MKFGGIQKQSLIDFPGKISCVLFTSGCNFRCPFCHNPDLVQGNNQAPPVIKQEEIYDFLQKRQGFLDGVVISGGEPTIQPDLSTICQNIKRMGYPIKLDTNGSRPEVLTQLIQNHHIDFIAMDIKTDPLDYPHTILHKENSQSILDSIALIMASDLPYEFRTTCIKPFVNESIIEKISRTIQGAKSYALQQFKDDHILSPDYFKEKAPHYTRSDLKAFQAQAAPWVKVCVIR